MNPFDLLSAEEYTSGIAVLTAKIDKLETDLGKHISPDRWSKEGVPDRPKLDSGRTPESTMKNFSLLHTHAYKLERLVDLATQKTSPTPPGQKTGTETQTQPGVVVKKYDPDARLAEYRATHSGHAPIHRADDKDTPDDKKPANSCPSCGGSAKCSHCDGAGREPGSSEACSECSGSGSCQDCLGTPGVKNDKAKKDNDDKKKEKKASAWNPDAKILAARGVASLIELKNLPPAVSD